MVLFDMDGLLLDSERVCLNCFLDTSRYFDLPDMQNVFMRMIGLRAADSLPILDTALHGKVSVAEFEKQWDDRIARQMADEIPVKAGAYELLKGLYANGIVVAVATSTRTVKAEDHLERAGLARFIEHVVGGDQVINGKPHPEIYTKAADVLCKSASECIVFEDSDPGTLAGVRSGARVVQVPDIRAPSAETIALGHIIAPDLLTGAKLVGLI